MSIVEALRDPGLFGRLPLFADFASRDRWLVFHKAWSALSMTAEEMRIYQHPHGPPDSADHPAVRGVRRRRPRLGQVVHGGADRDLPLLLP
ncbi:MAG: hypothetical protein IT294_14255 [Deltaproteobacteria bacterium]|nr:hypothetical protein [Deltaproteobacteria bacterium]